MSVAVRVIWALLWRAAVLLALWLVVLKFVFTRPTQFGESSLVSNQIRLQAVDKEGEGAGIMVGSSLIARLNPKIVSESCEGSPLVLCGLDGGRSELGLELVGHLGTNPSFLVIEANTLLLGKNKNDEILLKQPEEVVFKLAKKALWVRAENRPTALLYDRLKVWKDRRSAKKVSDFSGEEIEFGIQYSGTIGLEGDGFKIRGDQMISLVEGLGVSWDRVLFVMLPGGDVECSREYGCFKYIQSITGVKILDLDGAPLSKNFTYTDGRHLDLLSGNLASVLVGEALKKMGIGER